MQGAGCRVQGAGCRAQGAGNNVSGSLAQNWAMSGLSPSPPSSAPNCIRTHFQGLILGILGIPGVNFRYFQGLILGIKPWDPPRHPPQIAQKGYLARKKEPTPPGPQ